MIKAGHFDNTIRTMDNPSSFIYITIQNEKSVKKWWQHILFDFDAPVDWFYRMNQFTFDHVLGCFHCRRPTLSLLKVPVVSIKWCKFNIQYMLCVSICQSNNTPVIVSTNGIISVF